MSDKAFAIIVIAMILIAVMLSAALAFLLIARLRRTSDQPLSPPNRTGTMVVPVRLLGRTYGFFAYTKNGLSPRLELTPDGLRFKVFRADHWPFDAISEVDARFGLFTTQVSFRNRAGGSLYAHVADKATGRNLLRALPAHINLTPRALKMRDGAA